MGFARSNPLLAHSWHMASGRREETQIAACCMASRGLSEEGLQSRKRFEAEGGSFHWAR